MYYQLALSWKFLRRSARNCDCSARAPRSLSARVKLLLVSCSNSAIAAIGWFYFWDPCNTVGCQVPSGKLRELPKTANLSCTTPNEIILWYICMSQHFNVQAVAQLRSRRRAVRSACLRDPLIRFIVFHGVLEPSISVEYRWTRHCHRCSV